MPYAEAMARYGTDKPDLRFGHGDRGRDATAFARVRRSRRSARLVADGGVVRGFVRAGRRRATRARISTSSCDQAKQLGGGLTWVQRDGRRRRSELASRRLGEDALRAGARRCRRDGRATLLLLAAGPADDDRRSCSAQLRLQPRAGSRTCSTPSNARSSGSSTSRCSSGTREDKRWYSMHHPFTAPHDEDVDKLESDPGEVRAQGLRPRAQRHRRSAAAASVSTTRRCRRGSSRCSASATRRPGALRLLPRGARVRHAAARRHRARPRPHRRDALAARASIREVIAFPKTASAVDLMAGAPSPVDAKQLRELHIRCADSRSTCRRPSMQAARSPLPEDGRRDAVRFATTRTSSTSNRCSTSTSAPRATTCSSTATAQASSSVDRVVGQLAGADARRLQARATPT